MSEITAGVVCVNTFCNADSKYFAGYIAYMDRDEATRKEHINDFDIFSGYMGYMGNSRKTLAKEEPEKISGLFTDGCDLVGSEDVKKLKEVYKKAQGNGSMMWQTVISFDNKWLSEMGIFDSDNKILNEKALKRAVRNSVKTLQEKEKLTNSVWSGAIHYNTDNIHIHIAIVEPTPMREKKKYKQYEVVQIRDKWQYRKVKNPKTGKLERVPIYDENGNIAKKEEYVGKFKESSLRAMKSSVVSELANDKSVNEKITRLIRDEIVQGAKKYELYNDEEFRNAFMDIYKRLPKDRRVCNYGNSVIQPLRDDIDDLSMQFIEKHYKEQYDEVLRLIAKQAERYKIAYGGDENDFFDKKVNDIFYRLGNAILSEMKDLDKKEKEERRLSPDFVKADDEKDEVSLQNEKDAVGRGSSGNIIRNMYSDLLKNQRKMRRALYMLQRSMQNILESILNQRDYDELQRQIAAASERGSNNVGSEREEI